MATERQALSFSLSRHFYEYPRDRVLPISEEEHDRTCAFILNVLDQDMARKEVCGGGGSMMRFV